MANSSFNKVLDAVTTTTNSASINWMGGVGSIAAAGTWDSATVKLQVSPDDGTTWLDVGSASTLSDDGCANFEFPPCDLRLVLTVTGTSSITAWITEPYFPNSFR
tara:strand:- start:303 stop:617 length:315 start_codon:yes stop_codon:yes gene_type:complete